MRIRVAHISLQFSDTSAQHTHDIEKVFTRAAARGYAWITGTEAGPGAGNTTRELVRIGAKHGYKMFVPSAGSGRGSVTDAWIGVRSDLVKSGWKTAYLPVIPGSKHLYEEAKVKVDGPNWGPKGLVTVEFKSLPELGEINICAAHHLTRGQVKGKASIIHGVDHWALNRQMDVEIGKWMSTAGAGSALAFAGFDRNASDKNSSAFIPGGTSLADELKKWQDTGHGTIDWIVSHNKDGRVKGVNFNVLDDKEFFLYTDHFLVEGVFNVAPLAKK